LKKRILRVNIKIDPKTGKKYVLIHRKKYLIKEGTSKAKIASFVKKKVKDLGFLEGPRYTAPQTEALRLEHELESIQQRRAEPKEYELYQLSKDALISLAQQKGIPNSNRMTKSQLISILGNVPMEEKPPKIREAKELEAKVAEVIPFTRDELMKLLKVGNIKIRKNATLESLYSIYKGLQEQNQQLAEETVSPSDIEELKPILPRRRQRPISRPNVEKPTTREELIAFLTARNIKIRKNATIESLRKIYNGLQQQPEAPPPTSASELDFTTPEVKMTESVRAPLVPRIRQQPDVPAEVKTNDPLKLGSDKTGTEKERALIGSNEPIPEGYRGPEDIIIKSDSDEENKLGYKPRGPDDIIIRGDGKEIDERGLSNTEIDEIMKPLGDFYLGTIAHDQIHSMIIPKIKSRSNGAFIINTDPASKGGSHWQALAHFASPNSTHEINFFDSFADPIDSKLRKDLKDIANKLDAQTFLKLKENSVQLQDDRTSTCGFHCIRFILDRHRGKTFAQATGYDDKVKNDSIRGEGEINRFKKQIGFGFLPSFLQRPNSMIQQIKDKIKSAVFFPSREFSNAFKSIMSKYGNLRIKSARMRRAPIGSAINSLLNILSLGKFEQYRKEKNFDKYFHLGIVLELEGGKKLLLEKNAKPEFSENFKDTNDTVYMGPVTIRGQPTLNEFIQKTVDKNGMYKFTNYDPFKNNCQAFILMLLEANNSLTPALKNFIYQDVQSLLERIPSFTDKLARFATDSAARLQELTGNGNPPVLRNPKKLKHTSKTSRSKFLKLMEKFKK
jgi:hypothetical protein